MGWFYVLDNGIITEQNGQVVKIVKIGTTTIPQYRKWDYLTYSPKSPIYLLLFEIDVEPPELFQVENFRFVEYVYGEKNKPCIHICNGGGNEWYRSEVMSYVDEFFEVTKIKVLQKYTNDPYTERPYN